MAPLIFTSKTHTGHTMQVEEHKNCHNRAEISLRSLSVQIRSNLGHLAEQSYYQNILFFVTLALSYSQIDYVQTKSTLSWRGRSNARHDRIGRLPSGGRLPPERELAEQFSVSRPTIREAIIALEAQGYVRIKSGSGVYVLPQERTGNSAPNHEPARAGSASS